MNPTKPKIILFDIGGVLIEYGNVFKNVATEQNFDHKLIDATFDKYDDEITLGKITPQELYLKCLDENSIKADRDYNFIDGWVRDYEIIKPTHELVHQLSHKYKIGLFSNIYKAMVPEMIKRDVLPKIDYYKTFLSCEMGLQKPDLKAYRFITDSLGFEPQQILFVDDKAENLVPASQLGWKTFEFNRHDPEVSVVELNKILQ